METIPKEVLTPSNELSNIIVLTERNSGNGVLRQVTTKKDGVPNLADEPSNILVLTHRSESD